MELNLAVQQQIIEVCSSWARRVFSFCSEALVALTFLT